MLAVTLRQLEYFVAVVEAGTVASAAAGLHVTPSAISAGIDALEKTLGVQLFLRQRAKGSNLTAAGRALVGPARAAIAAGGEVEHAAAELKGELHGELTVGCFPPLSPWVLPELLDHFATHHPRVDVQIIESSSVDLQRMALRGEIDAALVYQQHLTTDEGSTIRLAPVRLRVVVSADHHLAHRESVHLHELAGEPAALVNVAPARDTVTRLIEAAGFTPNVRWSLSNLESLRALVGRGVAYSISMGKPPGDVSYEGKPLRYLRVADELPDNYAVLLYQDASAANAKVRALLRLARSGQLGISLRRMQEGSGADDAVPPA